MQKIEKPTILITSLGRTGTEFFSKFFAGIIPDCTSLHEPDIVQNIGVENKLAHFAQQVHRAGIWRMVVLKAIGKWTLVKLSDSRVMGTLENRSESKKLYNQRNGFINKMPGEVYVEANIGYYGLLDITPEVFTTHKAIFIVRDGRDWIRSHLSWGEFYGKSGIRKLFSHNWPTAKDIPRDPYNEKWDTLTRFEQMCWAWTRLNDYALRTISKNQNAMVFQFEKLFLGEEKYQVLNKLVSFSTSLPGIDTAHLGKASGWLERKSHQSSLNFPSWEKWPKKQKKQFKTICGAQMQKLGYNID